MNFTYIDRYTPLRVAVIYQALPPPLINGVRKDPKPGGYSDSGADIAFSLHQTGIDVATPVLMPDPANALDWVFPDTNDGLNAAVAAGANVIWANTVLFTGHPLTAHLHEKWIVGQLPDRQQRVDDKFETNAFLRAAGFPVVPSILLSKTKSSLSVSLSDLSESALLAHGLVFPLVIKPVRGRGSQGVSRVHDRSALHRAATVLFDANLFGDLLIIEPYLEGQELTLTVLLAPPSASTEKLPPFPLVLPPVKRFNHADGIAPYNGAVAVTSNSLALTSADCLDPRVQKIIHACAELFPQVGALAPIRIDCRADAVGNFYIFDVNMKPNMTGSGRPGREAEDSLSAIAARAFGWTYADLLRAMLERAWRLNHTFGYLYTQRVA